MRSKGSFTKHPHIYAIPFFLIKGFLNVENFISTATKVTDNLRRRKEYYGCFRLIDTTNLILVTVGQKLRAFILEITELQKNVTQAYFIAILRRLPPIKNIISAPFME